MYINPVGNSKETKYPNTERKNTSFKGLGQAALNASGSLMQAIENGGFAASFLIQDGLGMLTPRAITGFNRDREETGKINVKEGVEVLLRESITGPVMMATPFIVLGLLAATVGKSTFSNSNLIKRMGKTLKNTFAKRPENLKQAFYKDTIENISKDTLGGKLTAESSNKIMDKLLEMDRIEAAADLSKKARKTEVKKLSGEIVEELNNAVKSNTSNFYEVNRIKLDGRNFDSKQTIDAMRAYAKDFSKVPQENLNPDQLMHKSLANRFVTNVLTLGATLLAMFNIPKIYAFNKVPPGCHDTNYVNEEKGSKLDKITQKAEENTEKKDGNVSFKGAYDKFGKALAEKVPEKIFHLFEFNGANFTPALMTGMSVGGLLVPRGAKAVKRAPIKLDGEKDQTELHEVLIRDTASTFGVIYAVPILSNLLVKSYEEKSGFVLRNGNSVLSTADLKQIYGDISTPDKMKNFCGFISENKGDLRKVLGSLDNADEMLNLKDLASETKEVANAKIKDKVSVLKDTEIAKLLESRRPMKNGMNKMLARARNLNSVPGLVATMVLSPIILGVLIPKLTYRLTKEAHEEEKARKTPEKINALYAKINPNDRLASFAGKVQA
ncbi:hypothetical protein IJI31_03780 [bacterium]|nr:hypothetical protein [bacterium]